MLDLNYLAIAVAAVAAVVLSTVYYTLFAKQLAALSAAYANAASRRHGRSWSSSHGASSSPLCWRGWPRSSTSWTGRGR